VPASGFRRSLVGYRPVAVRAAVRDTEERLGAARAARSNDLSRREQEAAALRAAVLQAESQVAGEQQRIRSLLASIASASDRMHERVAEARAEFDAIEAQEAVAIAQVEAALGERYALGDAFRADVLSAVRRARGQLEHVARPTVEHSPVPSPDREAERPPVVVPLRPLRLADHGAGDGMG